VPRRSCSQILWRIRKFSQHSRLGYIHAGDSHTARSHRSRLLPQQADVVPQSRRTVRPSGLSGTAGGVAALSLAWSFAVLAKALSVGRRRGKRRGFRRFRGDFSQRISVLVAVSCYIKNPRAVAMLTACVRSDAPNLTRMFCICAFTVASEMNRREAMILLDVLRATSRSTSISRSVRSSSA